MKNNPKVSRNLLYINQVISVIGIIIMGVLFFNESSKPKIIGALFMTPFTCFPIILTQITCFLFKNHLSQILGFVALLLYGIWFGFVYMTLVHWSSDAQNAIGFVVVGIVSLPVMGIIWLAQLITHSKMKKSGDLK